jgi:hypothetical protein
MRMVYLGLALWGAAWAMLDVWSGQGLGMTAQLYVADIALFVWCIAEVYVRKNWLALAALPATWGLGLGCGLPLYLFLRTAPPR